MLQFNKYVGRVLAGRFLDAIARTAFRHDGLRDRLDSKGIDEEGSLPCQQADPSLFS